MEFLDILRPILLILLGALVITQILLPTILGRPWFPIFKRSWTIRREFDNLREEQSAEKLAKELQKARQHPTEEKEEEKQSGETSDTRS